MPQEEEAPILSRAAFDRLKAEHEELTTAGQRGVAERLEADLGEGGWRPSRGSTSRPPKPFEWKFTPADLAKLMKRLAEKEAALKPAA